MKDDAIALFVSPPSPPSARPTNSPPHPADLSLALCSQGRDSPLAALALPLVYALSSSRRSPLRLCTSLDVPPASLAPLSRSFRRLTRGSLPSAPAPLPYLVRTSSLASIQLPWSIDVYNPVATILVAILWTVFNCSHWDALISMWLSYHSSVVSGCL